jgi:hypothetical protein
MLTMFVAYACYYCAFLATHLQYRIRQAYQRATAGGACVRENVAKVHRLFRNSRFALYYYFGECVFGTVR